jgi:hypothetical protein
MIPTLGQESGNSYSSGGSLGDRYMKRPVVIAAVLIVAQSVLAFATSITDVSWNESNIQALRSYDKNAVEKFVNDTRGGDLLHATVGGFGWYDLASDHRYELVATEDLSGRAFFDYLAIYAHDSAGKAILQQWIEGERIGTNLAKVVQDLNGDGKCELIIPKVLISYTTAETFTWPAVYRLEDGKYIEASREFATYYDKQVLPGIDERISKNQATAAAGLPSQDTVVQIMERDKILRVLGRDPSAGLQDAYRWMKSDDPQVMQAAAATFQDIGGHDKEVRELQQALPAAIAHEMQSRKGD